MTATPLPPEQHDDRGECVLPAPRDTASHAIAAATAATAQFRRLAAASVRTIGVQRAMREELEDEIVAHLLDAWDSLRARGLDPERAASEAIAAFGPPAPVRRRFLARRLLHDARAAIRLPLAWVVFVVLDAIAPVVFSTFRTGSTPNAATLPAASLATYVGSAVAMLWVGHVGFRLGWRLCGHFIVRRSTVWELVAGLGVFAMSFGMLLALGPGLAFPTICDLVDRTLGRDSAVAFTALAVGLSVSLAALVKDLTHAPADFRAG